MPHLRTLCCLATFLALAACATNPLGPPTQRAFLIVNNPDGLALTLEVVDGDARWTVLDLDARDRHQLELVAAAYVLRTTTKNGTAAWPVPLFASTLPDDRAIELTVRTPPPQDPDFAFVPEGPTVIGDTLGIGQEDERPARIERVAAFFLARTEVTNADYAAFLTAVSTRVDPAWAAFDSKKFRCTRAADGTWSTDAPELPVVTISHPGALAYCVWRTEVTGQRHRLPTEIEWEKAARGPCSSVYDYGNVYTRRAANQESGTLRPVAQFPATGFGTHDLTGNAFEWTADRYPSRDPRDVFFVLRGGSFVLDGMYLRNSFRMRQRPDTRTDDFGFRVVREVAEEDGVR